MRIEVLCWVKRFFLSLREAGMGAPICSRTLVKVISKDCAAL